MTTTKKQP